MRLFALLLIIGFYFYLALQLTAMVGYDLDRTTLVIASVIGILTAFTWVLVDGWWSAIVKPYSPQKVMTETKETPNQIGCAAASGLVQLLLFIAAMIGLLFWIIRSR